MQHKTKLATAIAAGAATFGIVAASAASLGPLSGNGVGSSDAPVGSCDTDGASLAYTTTFNAAAGRFDVTGVDVSGLSAACDSLAVTVVLKDSASGAASQTATFSGTVAAGGASLTGASIAATALAGASLIVVG